MTTNPETASKSRRAKTSKAASDSTATQGGSKASSTKVVVPSLLAHTRSIEVSYASMGQATYSSLDFGAAPNDLFESLVKSATKSPVRVFARSGTGAFQHSGIDLEALAKHQASGKKGDENDPATANIWHAHSAFLADADTLIVRVGTFRVLRNYATPLMCNSDSYLKLLNAFIEKAEGCSSFDFVGDIAGRIAAQVTSGDALARNRRNMSHYVGVFRYETDEGSKFIAFGDGRSADATGAIAALIKQALLGQERLHGEIVYAGKVGHGAEVYPSQDMFTDGGAQATIKKRLCQMPGTATREDKKLGSVGGIAALTPQKVLNALKRIDTWYGAEVPKPLAVSAYGSDILMGRAHRARSATANEALPPSANLHQLLARIDEVTQNISSEALTTTAKGHASFMLACLIVGGPNGQEQKQNKAKKGGGPNEEAESEA